MLGWPLAPPLALPTATKAWGSSSGRGSAALAAITAGLVATYAPQRVQAATVGVAPITLGFDQQTPHQISINAPHTRALAEGTTARVDYRISGASTWIDAGYLYRTRTAYSALTDSFAGWIVDLNPGVTYDVRVEVIESGTTTYATSTRATRALPTENATANKTANTGNFSTVMAGLAAGDVVSLAAGTYNLANFNLVSPGTSGSPVVIRGAGIGQTILHDTQTGTGALHCAIDLDGSHITFEDLTISGTFSDSDDNATSVGVIMNTGTQTNVTFRRVKFDGCDQGIKVWSTHSVGLLVYDCVFAGNNTWARTWAFNSADGLSNYTWNDTGVHMPGDGNCVWNCTFTGHGDTVKIGYAPGGVSVWDSRARYVHHNWIKRAGDDGTIEFDECDGNCAAYDNRLSNGGSAVSFDMVLSGPVGFFRNTVVNVARGPFKFTSEVRGARIWNNTIVQTTKQDDASTAQDFGIYASSNGHSNEAWDLDMRNNVIIYRGANATADFNVVPSGTWQQDYNAWYPNSTFNMDDTAGSGANLAAAQSLYAPRMAHDVIAASDPFATAITLGANFQTEYTDHLDATLASGSAAKNAGVAIAGVTDGFSGTAPDMGAAISGRASVPVGAASDPYIPSWARSAVSQRWITVPVATTLDAIDPIDNPAINPNHPSTPEWSENTARQSAVVYAWCGGAYDDLGDEFWLGMGGGHRDYAGNEIYACGYNAEKPAFRMVRKPSGAIGNLLTTDDGQEASGVYSDGRPRAIHGYNKWIYVPGAGPVLAVHGNGSWSAAEGKEWSTWIDPRTGESNFSAEHPVASDSSGLGACYDSSRRAIWYTAVNTSPIYRYDIPSSGTPWSGSAASSVGSSRSRERYQALCYLPTYDLILIAHSAFDGSAGGFELFNPANSQYYTPTFSGSLPMGTTHGRTQWRWVPSLGAVCGWNNASNRTQITKLTPGADPLNDAWTVSALPVDGGNAVTPTAPPNPGGEVAYTAGRFTYSPRMGGFFVFNDTTGSVYFYKI